MRILLNYIRKNIKNRIDKNIFYVIIKDGNLPSYKCPNDEIGKHT